MEAHRMNPDSEDGQERPVVNNRPQRAYRGRLSAMFMELDRLLLASRTVYSRNKNKFKKRSRNMILREVTDLLNKIWIDDQVEAILRRSSIPGSGSKEVRVKTEEPAAESSRACSVQSNHGNTGDMSGSNSNPHQQRV
eukprot:2032264-Rhodomonas_salina.3